MKGPFPGFDSGSTCYPRLDEWQRAGVWERLHALLLAELRAAGEIGWSRAVVDSSHVQAKKRAPKRARARLREAETGRSISLVDATGIPLAWTLTGGNRNDVTQLIPLVDAVPAVRGRVGRPRRRPERIMADRGYDHDNYRREPRQRGVTPRSPTARPTTAPVWAVPAGSLSKRLPGSTSSGGCSSARRVPSTSV